MAVDEHAYLRIGELARRTGTTPELLRAWERRYGLLQPVRTAGGFRLYGVADEERVGRMLGHLRTGLSAAEAARLAVAAEQHPATAEAEPSGDDAVRELLEAVERYDESAVHALLDRLLGTFSTPTVLTRVLLPALHELGDGWRAGRVSVAHEHFASSVIRGRLLGLARGWDAGLGPRALLACPPRERHDLGLIAFGLLLRHQAWRIVFLGADTPLETLREAVAEARPAVVVLSAVDRRRFVAAEEAVAAIARDAPVRLGGAGAAALTDRLAPLRLPSDPAEAAAVLSREYRAA